VISLGRLVCSFLFLVSRCQRGGKLF
jgi:hypothetical protein